MIIHYIILSSTLYLKKIYKMQSTKTNVFTHIFQFIIKLQN